MAIRRAVVYHARAAHTLSAGIELNATQLFSFKSCVVNKDTLEKPNTINLDNIVALRGEKFHYHPSLKHSKADFVRKV